ncbi:VOC family protein [Modestobacter altitudinis]|uniref:VOC family protein n=1 Tax=Modestobacter altitudinis TaxID=2213158 RepID=UPI002482CED5|nr:VOC family protein [Modestobacter altitudinis]
MKIALTSVLVDDQEKALRFYTDVLGFRPKHDVPMGEHRWLTVVSPEAPEGVELLLEPDGHPAVRPFKEALVATASRSPPSRSRTCTPSTPGWSRPGSPSPRRR